MRLNLYPARKARIEMLPLIDIVFLLLVFFIYAMLSMAVHRGLPIVLPKSSATNIEKQLILSITVKTNGDIYLDKRKISPSDLSGALREKARDESQSGVLLFADQNLPYQKLFNVLDRIKKAGISKISLQAQKSEQQ
jgi:biopolymer transport protein ExbD